MTIKRLGSNASFMNGFQLEKDKLYKAFHGDVLELLPNELLYCIQFDPPPPNLKEEDNRNRLPIVQSLPMKQAKLEICLSATENKWESFDSGQMLIFTSKGVTSSAKVTAVSSHCNVIANDFRNICR